MARFVSHDTDSRLLPAAKKARSGDARWDRLEHGAPPATAMLHAATEAGDGAMQKIYDELGSAAAAAAAGAGAGYGLREEAGAAAWGTSQTPPRRFPPAFCSPMTSPLVRRPAPATGYDASPLGDGPFSPFGDGDLSSARTGRLCICALSPGEPGQLPTSPICFTKAATSPGVLSPQGVTDERSLWTAYELRFSTSWIGVTKVGSSCDGASFVLAETGQSFEVSWAELAEMEQSARLVEYDQAALGKGKPREVGAEFSSEDEGLLRMTMALNEEPQDWQAISVQLGRSDWDCKRKWAEMCQRKPAGAIARRVSDARWWSTQGLKIEKNEVAQGGERAWFPGTVASCHDTRGGCCVSWDGPYPAESMVLPKAEVRLQAVQDSSRDTHTLPADEGAVRSPLDVRLVQVNISANAKHACLRDLVLLLRGRHERKEDENEEAEQLASEVQGQLSPRDVTERSHGCGIVISIDAVRKLLNDGVGIDFDRLRLCGFHEELVSRMMVKKAKHLTSRRVTVSAALPSRKQASHTTSGSSLGLPAAGSSRRARTAVSRLDPTQNAARPQWGSSSSGNLSAGADKPANRSTVSFAAVDEVQQPADPSMERVAIWHRASRRKVAGKAAPQRRNLEAYLRNNPGAEVYAGQDKLQKHQPSVEDAGGASDKEATPRTPIPKEAEAQDDSEPEESEEEVGLDSVCEQCSAAHDGTFGSGRFCSDDCKNQFCAEKARAARKENEDSVCEQCSAVHDGSWGSGRFCQERCARAYSSSRQEKRKAATQKSKGAQPTATSTVAPQPDTTIPQAASQLLKPKPANWSEEELARLRQGVEMYQAENAGEVLWKKVAALVGTRVPHACSCKFARI